MTAAAATATAAVAEAEDEAAPEGSEAIDVYRHERRFLLKRAELVRFLGAIGSVTTVEVYDRDRPMAFTRTTYLDTDDLAYFRSCLGPVARRLRIREYAFARTPGETPTLGDLCYLELKQNAGDARAKVRISADPQAITRLISGAGGEATPGDGDGVADVADNQTIALRSIKAELRRHRVAPRIATWYRRLSLRGDGGRVRITLDDGLLFSRPQPLGRPGQAVLPAGETVARGPARVLEIKYMGDPPAWLQAATADLTPAPDFSKFRTGMMALARHTGIEMTPAALAAVASSSESPFPPNGAPGLTLVGGGDR